MRARWSHSVALAAGALGTAVTAFAADGAVTLRYDVRFGPLRLLSVQVATEVDHARYRSRSVMQTEGVIGKLFPWTAESQVTGRREGSELRPQSHRAVGRYRNQERLVEIDYQDDGQVRSRVEPPPARDDRSAVPDALQQATIDPLTASLRAAAGECTGTIPVFDGRRRYDLRLVALPPADLPAAPPRLYSGPTHRCRAQIEARAGFWESDPRDSEQPSYLDYWLATPRPGLPTVPVYLELIGARGTLRIDLTGIETGANFSALPTADRRGHRPSTQPPPEPFRSNSLARVAGLATELTD